MPDDEAPESGGIREKFSKRSEEALGELAETILDNPVLKEALSAAAGAREKAVQAQQVAMSAFNIPSASDIERLTRRVRSVSQRLEGVEDGVDRVEESLTPSRGAGNQDQLSAIEARLEELVGEVAALRQRLGDGAAVSSD